MRRGAKMEPKDYNVVDGRLDMAIGEHMSRRTLLKRSAALAFSIPAVSALIAACEDAEDDDPDAAAVEEDDDPDAASVEEDDDPDGRDEVEDDEEPDEVAEEEEATEGEEPEEAGAGGTIRVAVPQLVSDPTTMSPLFPQGGAENQIALLHFGGLVKPTIEMTEVQPDLADSWELEEDGTGGTFYISEDAYWSDGEPVVADDVIFTYELLGDPEVGASSGAPLIRALVGGPEYQSGDSDDLPGVSSVDDKAVVFELSRPNAVFMDLVADYTGQGIVPKHVYENIERSELNGHQLSRNPEVGAGPFLLSRWESEQFLEFVANESYVGGAPQADSIVVMLMQPTVALAQLETGELDLTYVPFDELERTQQYEGVVTELRDSVEYVELLVNTSQTYLTQSVRQAMMYALDKEGIIDAAYDGYGEPVVTPFSAEWLGDIVAEADLNPYEYDPDRARQILEDEGWDENQPVSLVFPSDFEEHLTLWTMIQSNFADVGINLVLEQVEFPLLRERRVDGDYDLITMWGSQAGRDPAHIATRYILDASGYTHTRWANEEFNELEQVAVSTTDEDERREAYLRMAQLTNEELPSLPLFIPYGIFAYSERLQGFESPRHFGLVLIDADQWSLES
jgi:ABC-type transport system substrate-binding protein